MKIETCDIDKLHYVYTSSMSRVQDLVAQYVCNSTHEFEARMVPEKPVNLSYTLSQLGEPVVLYQIDFLGDLGQRKRLVFPAGVGPSQSTSIKKIQLAVAHIKTTASRIKIALSDERPVSALVLAECNITLARIKLVLRYEIADWNLDIAFTSEARDWSTAFIKPRRDVLLAPLVYSVAGACERARLFDRTEYEVEYTGAGVPRFDAEHWNRVLFAGAPSDYQSQLEQLAQIIGTPHIKQNFDFTSLMPRALELPLDEWREYHQDFENMTVRKKIDGERCIVSFAGSECMTLFNGRYSTHAARDDVCMRTLVVDCEYHRDTYHVLHVIIVDGELAGSDYASIHALESSALLGELAVRFGVAIQTCPYMRAGSDLQALEEFYTRASAHVEKTDGWLYSTDDTYWQKRVVKWKPVPTFDFMVYRCPPEFSGKYPYTCEPDQQVWLLLVGTRRQDAARVKLPASMRALTRGEYTSALFVGNDTAHTHVWRFDSQLAAMKPEDFHGKIVELSYGNTGWRFEKVRTDRVSVVDGGVYTGNNDRVAQAIWRRMREQFKLAWIAEPPARVDRSRDECVARALELALVAHAGSLTMINVRVARVGALMILDRKHQWMNQANTSVRASDDESMAEFIGGTQVVVAEVGARWMKWLAPGGHVLLAGCEPECALAGAEHVLEHEGFHVWSWRKPLAGTARMSSADVHHENPHLRSIADANFTHVFTRTLNSEIQAVAVASNPDQSSMRVAHAYGVLLCALESASELASGTLCVIDPALASVATVLRYLCSGVQFVIADHDVAGLVDLLIASTNRVHLAQRYKPLASAYLVRASEYTGRNTHCVKFIPFEDTLQNHVWLTSNTYNRTSDVNQARLTQELRYYRSEYRLSCFKYTPVPDARDHCYNCRLESYILNRYRLSAHAGARKTSSHLLDLNALIDVLQQSL